MPKVDPVTITYDTHGRPTQVTHSTGTGARTSQVTYDAAGFVATATDPLSRVTTYTRDAIGRVLTVTRPDNKIVASAYDKQGNLTQLTLPHGRIHSFVYNDVDDNTQTTPPSLGTWAPQTVYEYNLDRQLTKVTRPDGGIVTFAYDPTIGRQTSETSPLGTKTFSYSATSGLLTGITGIGGYNLGFTYDGDAITKVTWTGSLTGEVGFTRNAKQQIETIYGSAGGTGLGNINFTYDKDGFLTTANTLEITRDPQNGQLVSTKHDWMSDSWTYSPFGEPSVYRAYYRWDNTTRYQATYTRNKVGQITKNVEITNGVTTTWDYTYNTLGWLTAVKKNGAAFQSYVYDANGNRTSIVAGGTTTAATYDAQDRLTVFGNTTYAYNNAGDLVSSSVGTAKTDFSYDIYGNLLSVKKPSGTTINYNVDPLGRRIRKSVNGTMVQGFLWADELHPIAELNATGGIVAKFIYAEKGNVPSAMSKGGTDYRIISDHLGSVRMVVNNNSGAILQQLDYDPYGRVIVDTNPGFQPFGYAGGLYDRDTGLVRFGRRDYDPVVGRWTSKDPIGFSGGLNLYGYVVQDPVNLVDPDGRNPADAAGAGWLDAATFGYGTTVMDYFGLVRLYDLDDPTDRAAYEAAGWSAGFARKAAALPKCAAKPPISAIKKALKAVHDRVGKLRKGEPGNFGSPQRGDSKLGYRLDPPHPNRPPGDPELKDHINWWNWSSGKKRSGGKWGAEPIE